MQNTIYEKLNKMFFGLRMTWKNVILFAIITGVFTGIVMQMHFLDITSLHMIGVSYEAWILFAIIICMNCETAKEACIKTFVFFLISQPLVYLTMWPEYHSFPWHYYRFWAILTVLTIPGGFICWQVKRKNLPGTLVLSVANVFLAVIGLDAALSAFRAGGFPWGIGVTIFCVLQIIVYIWVLIPLKKNRVIATLLVIILSVAICWSSITGHVKAMSNIYDEQITANATVVVQDENIVTASPCDEGIDLIANKIGTTEITCTLEDGTVLKYQVTVTYDGLINSVSIK